MATFDIEEEEGMRWIKVTLQDEAARAAKGALSHMSGDIVMDSPMPGFHDLLVSALSDELPEVVELRLRGVAAPSGVSILSAAARIAPSVPRADSGPRRLRGF